MTDINADLLQLFTDLKKKSAGTCTCTKTRVSSKKQQLVEELQKTIISKFKKRKVYSSFRDNIRGSDIADMQLITKFN